MCMKLHRAAFEKVAAAARKALEEHMQQYIDVGHFVSLTPAAAALFRYQSQGCLRKGTKGRVVNIRRAGAGRKIQVDAALGRYWYAESELDRVASFDSSSEDSSDEEGAEQELGAEPEGADGMGGGVDRVRAAAFLAKVRKGCCGCL